MGVIGKGVFSGGVCAGLCAVLLTASLAVAERPLGPANDGTGADVPPPAEAPCTAGTQRLPANIRVDADFMPRIRVMLRRSPTFRAQCQKLAANPWVHVAVRLDPTFYDRHSLRAATTIQRPQPRLIVAIVSMQGLADPAMWVSHEFEHLIEQIDAVDVASLADERLVAWPSGSGMYETLRAIRAGDAVFSEVQAPAHHGNFVD